jgi:hypothetical protein
MLYDFASNTGTSIASGPGPLPNTTAPDVTSLPASSFGDLGPDF